MRALAREIDGLELPAVEKISEASQEDPFQVLIGTLLSARTQDATTAAASERLFKAADTIGTIHYSRFTLLSERTLLFLGDFDGEFGALMAQMSRLAPRCAECRIHWPSGVQERSRQPAPSLVSRRGSPPVVGTA